MIRVLLYVVVLVVGSFVATTAEADDYDDLGCYVGSMTRSEFYSARDRAAWKVVDPKREAADLEEYRASERARKQRYADEDAVHAAWRAKNPCSFKVGDTLNHDHNLWPGVVWTVQKIKPHPAGGWLMDVVDTQGRERQFKPEDCIALMPGSTWKPKRPLPIISRDEADAVTFDKPDAAYTDEIEKWKAAYDREQARKAKKAAKKPNGKSAAVSSHFPITLAFGLIGNAVNYVPAEAAILFPRLRVLQLIWNTNGCANGKCGVPAAVKPMPLPANAAPRFRKECGPNGCRLVPVK